MRGRPDGWGEYTWDNGATYVGEFKNGLKHGKGYWTKGDNTKDNPGSSYQGDYKLDKKWGTGTFTWPSGNTYFGEYVNDERHGKGLMKWMDGSSYDGEWSRGV